MRDCGKQTHFCGKERNKGEKKSRDRKTEKDPKGIMLHKLKFETKVEEKDSNLEWTVIGPWKHTDDELEERNTDEVRAGIEEVFKGLSRKEEKNQQVAINFVNRLVA